MTSDEREPPRASRVLIACTCLTHGGAVNFTNAAVTKIVRRERREKKPM